MNANVLIAVCDKCHRSLVRVGPPENKTGGIEVSWRYRDSRERGNPRRQSHVQLPLSMHKAHNGQPPDFTETWVHCHCGRSVVDVEAVVAAYEADAARRGRIPISELLA